MRKLFLFILLAVLLSVCPVRAEQIYIDDYQGMVAGDPLTDVPFTPTLGPTNSALWIYVNGSSIAQVVDTRLDGMSAKVNVPTGSAMDYIAHLGAEYGNGRFLVQWDLIVNSLNQNTDYGLFTVRFPTPDNNMQILFGFMNDGRLIKFNALPSEGSLVTVGSFGANIRYNVSLTYDLLNGQYSVMINGVNVIADVPIPNYLDKISIDKFGFDINQSIQIGQSPLPQGNIYYLDNVRFSRIEAVQEPSTLLLLVVGLAGLFAYRGKN